MPAQRRHKDDLVAERVAPFWNRTFLNGRMDRVDLHPGDEEDPLLRQLPEPHMADANGKDSFGTDGFGAGSFRAALPASIGCPLLRWSLADELVSPFDEVLHIRRVGVASIMLAPCELTIEKSCVYRRHFGGMIIAFKVESFST